MTAYVVPLIFLTVLIVAVFKKASPYSSFVQGAAQATDLIKTVLPYLVVVMVAVELFRESGVSAAVARFLSPVFGFFGLPCELCELILIRPLSGAGALGILSDIYDLYGTDSFIGNCASIIYGSFAEEKLFSAFTQETSLLLPTSILRCLPVLPQALRERI